MKNQEAASVITQDCINFRNYLRDELKIEAFKEFIFTYTFPLAEIDDLIKAAAAEGKTPVSLRLYYGCDKSGKDHKLYMSLLDSNREVIVDSSPKEESDSGTPSLPNTEENSSSLESTAIPNAITPFSAESMAAVRKCPPGGTSSDRLISAVFS